MRMKRIELRIESETDFSNRIKSYTQKIDSNIFNKKLVDETLSVASLSDLQKILTPKRIELLIAIRDLKPDSIYKLANLVGRKQENVQNDVNFLAHLGLIDLIGEKDGRKKKMPKVKYDVLDLRVPLVAV